MTRHFALALSVLLATSSGCTDNKKKMQEAQKRRDAEKKAAEEKEAARLKALTPKVNRAQLGAPWDDPAYLRVTLGRPCPDGLWSIFPGAPGEGDEVARNEAKRPELAQKMRDSTFVVLLSHGAGVSMRKYNAKKKQLTVEVDGLVECFDGLGLLSVAWGEPAKPFRPPHVDPEDEEAEMSSPQAVWRAQPLLFPLPFATAAEAKKFRDGPGLGLEARLVFKLGKVDLDKKVLKTSKPLPDAGAVNEQLDWGAGRLVHVELVGVRLGTDFEKTLVVER
jgi:hypothetical protein